MSDELKFLLGSMQRCIQLHGADLRRVESLMPINVEQNAKSDFGRGVVAGVVHVYYQLGQTAQGRQAILDLGFEPLGQDVKRRGWGDHEKIHKATVAALVAAGVIS